MNLYSFILKQVDRWEDMFAQDRTHDRAISLGMGLLCGVGDRTITRAIGCLGNEQKDWSADYKFFSRSNWDSPQLFQPILEYIQEEYQLERLVVAMDDTNLPREGSHIPDCQWLRDPMSPPFHPNLIWGHRFLQASVVLPLYREDRTSSPRCVPIAYELAPVVKKPGRKASPELWQEYRCQKKQINLSVHFVNQAKAIRKQLNQCGQAQQPIFITGDGSFCNRTVMRVNWEQDNIALTVRCRKDIKLCHRAEAGGKKFYGEEKFTPEDVRKEAARGRWKNTNVFHGGRYRKVKYKELKQVYWQGGARKRELRLIVLTSVGYRTTKNGRTYYRKPAYLLTTDSKTAARVLIQDYFDRWGIETNHQDEKDILGVGEAQVWNEKSVRKVPALKVAMYSWLLLGGLHCYGPKRTNDYEPLPKWRRNARRPSCRDLLTLLRKQMAAGRDQLPTASSKSTHKTMILTAAA